MRGVGPAGNRDGMKLSGVQDFRIEGCRVQNWGSGWVGHRPGRVPARDHRRLHVCRRGRRLRQRRAKRKGGSRDIAIRRCRFSNAGGRAVNVGGNTGLAYFRPPGRFRGEGHGGQDCEFIGGMSAIAFVGVNGALVQHNTIYRPRRWAMRILQENGNPRLVACRNGRFSSNVVAFRSDECREVVNVGGQTAPRDVCVCGERLALPRPAGRRERLVRLPPCPRRKEPMMQHPRSELPSQAICNFAKESRTTPACEPKQFRRKRRRPNSHPKRES